MNIRGEEKWEGNLGSSCKIIGLNSLDGEKIEKHYFDLVKLCLA